MMEKECRTCRGEKYFHVGDRISLGGNKTFHSHSELGLLAESKGIMSVSLTNKSKVVIINPSGAKPSDYKRAKQLGVRIVTPDEFKSLIKSSCRANVIQIKNPIFATRLGEGKTIYTLGLDKVQEKTLTQFLVKSGSKLAVQRKPSVSAVVTTTRFLNTGRADVFRVWGVPIYIFGRVIK